MNDAEFSKLQQQMKTAAATLHGIFAEIGIDLLTASWNSVLPKKQMRRATAILC